MSAEIKKEIQFEIAHVLFIDIVGYSKLSINEQRAAVDELTEIVRATEQFKKAEAADRLIKIATGDGMVLVFYTSPEAPVRCAVELSRALKDHPRLRVRMGIHSGPVSGVVDVTGRTNLAGAGLNMARRVMDCGDAGHILLSKHVAEDLSEFEEWRPLLHELGSCEVKHGVRVSVVNFYDDQFGNAKLPRRFETAQKRRMHLRWVAMTAVLLGLAAIVAGIAMFSRYRVRSALAVPEKSIAVLPFQNLSADPENAFFTDAVQDEILNDLAKIADLKVISRTSAMQYKTGVKRNLREIANELGVAHVVEGSVQRAGNRVRISAQLIDARNDTHVWVQTYDRDLADVFAIQSEIAKAIADQLRAKLSPTEMAAIERPPTADLVANKLYVQAKKELETSANDPNAKQNWLEAARLLDDAVARDPRFMRAYSLLSKVHIDLYSNGFDHTPARRELANAAAQAASRLQPNAGEVHLALADYAYHGFQDYKTARAELDLARSTLPNNVVIYFFTALIDRDQARWTEAMRNWDRALDLDPRNFRVLEETGFTYTALRLYPQASRLLQRALTISPHDYVARTALAQIPLFERADTQPLRATLSTILTEEPGASEKIAYPLFYCAMLERDSVATARALTAIHATDAMTRSASEWFVGLAARTFGDASKAHSAFTAARAILEKVVRDQPDYAPAWSRLGLIDAGLGRKDDAVREGRRACELLPVSKDSWEGPSFITTLAIIYAWTDDKDLALEQLEMAAQIPNGVTYGDLKLDPRFDALRGDPRFEKIVASLAPKKTVKPNQAVLRKGAMFDITMTN